MGARSRPRAGVRFFRTEAFLNVDGKKRKLQIPNGTQKARNDSIQRNKI